MNIMAVTENLSAFSVVLIVHSLVLNYVQFWVIAKILIRVHNYIIQFKEFRPLLGDSNAGTKRPRGIQCL